MELKAVTFNVDSFMNKGHINYFIQHKVNNELPFKYISYKCSRGATLSVVNIYTHPTSSTVGAANK